jgi:sortase (surface protein transpeptidase)
MGPDTRPNHVLRVDRRRLSCVFALCIFFLLAACGGPGEAVTKLPTESGQATATPDLAATVIPSVARELSTLNAFAETYGYPVQANLGHIRIPRIGVDAPIAARTVAPDLQLSHLNPYGPADVTWYNFSTPGYGGEPGTDTNAVFAGHVDYAYHVAYADAYYQGAGVFAGVESLEPNDAIEISMYGATTRYAVVWKKEVSEAFDWGSLYAAKQPEGDSITLISCTGEFDPATQEYGSRTVVRARRY